MIMISNQHGITEFNLEQISFLNGDGRIPEICP